MVWKLTLPTVAFEFKNTWGFIMGARQLFQRFFVTYFWLGVLLVVFSIIVNLKVPATGPVASVALKTIETIGIAVVVAAVFDFAVGTNSFIKRIKSLLQGIIVDQDFLGNLDHNSKKRALTALISPSEEERKINAPLEAFYKTYINQILNVSKICVRSNYIFNANIYFDKKKNKIAAKTEISYRIHASKHGYDPISIGFYGSGEDSDVSSVVLTNPIGERMEIDNFSWNNTGAESTINKKTEISLEEFGKSWPHLNVEILIEEIGHDNWIELAWKALQPTDGLRFNVRCDRGIITRANNVFVHGVKIHTEKEQDGELQYSCNQWLNQGSGVVLIAVLEEETPETHIDLSLKENKAEG